MYTRITINFSFQDNLDLFKADSNSDIWKAYVDYVDEMFIRITINLSFQDNLDLFKADSNSDIWKAYVDYVDEMIVDGFFNTIHCSLKFLLDNTDPKNHLDDLFKALLELQSQEMVFNPSLDFGVPDGFYDLVDGLVGDIYKQSSLIQRLAAHSGQEHYQPDLEDMEELLEMRLIGPQRKKNCLRGFRQSETQTSLLSYRD